MGVVNLFTELADYSGVIQNWTGANEQLVAEMCGQTLAIDTSVWIFQCSQQQDLKDAIYDEHARVLYTMIHRVRGVGQGQGRRASDAHAFCTCWLEPAPPLQATETSATAHLAPHPSSAALPFRPPHPHTSLPAPSDHQSAAPRRDARVRAGGRHARGQDGKAPAAVSSWGQLGAEPARLSVVLYWSGHEAGSAGAGAAGLRGRGMRAGGVGSPRGSFSMPTCELLAWRPVRARQRPGPARPPPHTGAWPRAWAAWRAATGAAAATTHWGAAWCSCWT